MMNNALSHPTDECCSSMASTALSTEFSRDWIWLADSFNRKRVTNCSTLVPRSYTCSEWGRKRQEEGIEGEKTDKSTSALFDDLKHVYLIKSCLRNSSKLCSSFKQNMIRRVSGEEQISKKGEKQDAAHVGKSLGQVKFWKLVMVLDIRGAKAHWSFDILTASLNTQGLFYTIEA